MNGENAGPRSADARRHMAELLGSESQLLTQLAQLLAEELEILRGDDAVAIESIGASRHDCVAALTQLEAERAGDCRLYGFGSERDAFARLLAWCDPDSSLRQRWLANLELARRCRSLNERNGSVVSLKLGNVRKLLATLRGTANVAPYGPAAARPVSFTPRELGIA